VGFFDLSAQGLEVEVELAQELGLGAGGLEFEGDKALKLSVVE
jgi:hypothetical protein